MERNLVIITAGFKHVYRVKRVKIFDRIPNEKNSFHKIGHRLENLNYFEVFMTFANDFSIKFAFVHFMKNTLIKPM